jgi:hypothetical protein
MGRRASSVAFALVTAVAWAALVLALIGWINNHTRLDTVTRSAIRSESPVVVHLDPVGGSDARTGAAPASAVLTLVRAISVLAESSGPLAVIRVSAGTLDLGPNPRLQLGPLVDQYQALRVEGERQAVLQDTVAATAVLNPLSTAWYQITGTTGGYVADAYARHFVSNDDMGRVYVVESNGGNTVNTIAGTSLPAASQSVYLPLPVDDVPWNVGERFTLFRVGATVITWTGQLSLDIPYNTVTFDSVWLNPTAAGSRVRAPDGPQHRVVFDACVMTLQSSGGTLPSFIGSMLMRGVYATAAVPSATLTGWQRNRCLMTESLWVDNDTVLIYSGSCSAIWVKSTGRNGSYAMIVQVAAQFYGRSIEVTGHTLHGIVVDQASISVINGVRIVRNVGASVASHQMSTDTESQSLFANVDIECIPQSLCTAALEVQEGTKVRMTGNMRLIANRLINVVAHGALDFYAIASWTIPTGGFVGAPIGVGQGAMLSLLPISPMAISTVGSAFPIVSVSGGRVDFIGAAANFQWSTNSGVPLVSVVRGGVITTSNGIGVNGMNVSNFNYGPTSTGIIKCGANAISAWTVSENDYAAVGSQNCACSR